MEDRASLLRVQPLVESDSTVNRAKKGPTAVPSTWWLVLLTMWCGIVNNASFCVLLGASLEIANEFGQSRYQPLIVNISTLGSVIGVFLSSRLMVGRMTDRERLALVVTGNVAGYALIAIAYRVAPWDSEPHTAGPDETPPSWGFWLCCAGACVLGFFQSCGEVLNLGVCRVFDPSMLAGWGAGTGVSGIVGPFLFVALHSAVDLDVCPHPRRPNFAPHPLRSPTPTLPPLLTLLHARTHRHTRVGHADRPDRAGDAGHATPLRWRALAHPCEARRRPRRPRRAVVVVAAVVVDDARRLVAVVRRRRWRVTARRRPPGPPRQ